MSIVSHCCQDNQGLAERLAEIDALVEAQAEDEGLWSVPAEGTQRIAEAYLQQELRRLHAVIEGTRQAQKETAVPASDTYAAGGNPGTVVEPGPPPVAQARQDAFVRATEIEMERAKQRMFADLNDPTKCACSAEGACLAHETTAQIDDGITRYCTHETPGPCKACIGETPIQDPFADFCAKCVHPKGWHRKNEAACIECGCLEFTARTSNASKEPL